MCKYISRTAINASLPTGVHILICVEVILSGTRIARYYLTPLPFDVVAELVLGHHFTSKQRESGHHPELNHQAK